MKAMVCEMCGSNDILKKDGMYVCQNCGTKYDPEEAKKLLVEVSGSVTIDNSKKIENYYQLARRAKDSGNSIEAAKFYDLIRQELPNDWEASFYATYFTAMQTNIAGIVNATYTIKAGALSALKLIKTNIVEPEKQTMAVMDLTNSVALSAISMYKSAMNHFSKFSSTDSALTEFKERSNAICKMCLDIGDAIEMLFENKNNDLAASAAQLWRIAFTCCSSWNPFPKDENTYLEKIKPFYPDFEYKKSTGSSSGCYVATSIYGSYDCPEVWVLRRYRDYKLAETWYGRVFIRSYYATSPTLVKWFGNTSWFKNLLKPNLDNMVTHLKAKGFSDDPYSDKIW